MDEFIKKKFVACEDCQYAIIAGTAEKDVCIAEHLAQCPDCRSFADFQQSLLAADPVIHNQIPDFAGIRKEAGRRQRVRRTNLRFVLLPLSAAAAAMIAVGGIFFHTRVEPISTNEYLLADVEVLNAALEASSVMLTWDTALNLDQCRSSMRAARDGNDNWNIEIFNPYSEDWL